jgi:multidrug efflux pump subunit AcrA (membrane-fusion protein)
VYIGLPQAYSQEVEPGDEAVLEFSEMPGRKFPGKVVRTAGAIDPISRTLLTEVQVPNHDGKLFAGAHVTVRIKLTSGGVPVTVPVNTLLFRDEQGVQVGIVEADNTVRLARVTMGRDYGTTVEIVHGLAETDNVIVNPSDSLAPGVKVRVAPADKPAAPAKSSK